MSAPGAAGQMVRLAGIGLLAAGVSMALYVAGRLYAGTSRSACSGGSGWMRSRSRPCWRLSCSAWRCCRSCWRRGSTGSCRWRAARRAWCGWRTGSSASAVRAYRADRGALPARLRCAAHQHQGCCAFGRGLFLLWRLCREGAAGPKPAAARLGTAGRRGAVCVTSLLVLGRCFGFVAADRGLVTRGPYAVVRHPVYASYLLIQSGYLLQSISLRNAMVMALASGCNVGRALMEERLLARSPAYRAYRRRVPWRLVPGLW
jgi:hypothetical protein